MAVAVCVVAVSSVALWGCLEGARGARQLDAAPLAPIAGPGTPGDDVRVESFGECAPPAFQQVDTCDPSRAELPAPVGANGGVGEQLLSVH